MQKTFRITVDGRSYTVVVEEITAPPPPTGALPDPPAAPAPIAAGTGPQITPLAGIVTSIEVQIGQAVHPGDKIATIEAMKMKTVVVAHGAGTVTAIAVKVNDSVETGQELLTLG